MAAEAAAQATAQEYDYVIIGGGTAGLVLAARLTEDPSKTVVVLEAGEKRFDDPNAMIPALFTTLYGKEEYDWDFHTTPQPHLANRKLHWPRGKVLGGSSAINFLMHSHASRVDLDNWEALGNKGWNFDNLVPFYRKSETYNPPSAEAAALLGVTVDPALHGTSGPIQTSFPEGMGPLDGAWSKTFDALGLGVKGHDPREGATLGGYSLPKSMDKMARRSTAATGYYLPNTGRKNLTVLTGAMVQKIEFAPRGEAEDDVVATGVRFKVGEEAFTVRSKGEVILSAGTVQSPQILELSGVGGRKLLESYGLDVVVENANVGENLQDHMLVPVAFAANPGLPTAEMLRQPGVIEWALNEWQTKGAGPLASGPTGTAFLDYGSIVTESERAASLAKLKKLLDEDLPSTPAPVLPSGLAKQLALQRAQYLNPVEADVQLNLGVSGVNPDSGDAVGGFFTHDDEGGYTGFVAAHTHALSRGSVHIQSADVAVKPALDPRYLSHPVDKEVLVQGLVFANRFFATEPFNSLLPDNLDGPGKRIQPAFGVAASEGLTAETAARIVERASTTSYHPIGTCAMLPREDGGVVDAELRVYGTKNLRVVDASVAPLHVRGNIASMVYGVAERAAALIKGELEA